MVTLLPACRLALLVLDLSALEIIQTYLPCMFQQLWPWGAADNEQIPAPPSPPHQEAFIEHHKEQ